MNVATPPLKPTSPESTPPRLTELARFAGCAAKISQADLHTALAGLPVAADPRVLVGHDTSDDAAVIRLRDDLALVETSTIRSTTAASPPPMRSPTSMPWAPRRSMR